jgi:sugar O-acyltransferase (sialic acid O-acetyltransferase NeuD family)
MELVIIGAGGHGKVVLDILRAAGQHEPVAFLDADPALAGTEVFGVPVLGAINLLPKLRQQKVRHAIVAIGDNRARLQYAGLLRGQGFELASAVHPTAFVSPTAKLGVNVVVAPQAAVITDTRIGDSAIINTGAAVDHECDVAEGVHIGPGARLAGRVRVGAGAFVGLGASVIQCLTIGQYAMVGAGAVVTADVPDFATVVGVPARVIRVAAAPMPDGVGAA